MGKFGKLFFEGLRVTHAVVRNRMLQAGGGYRAGIDGI
jgi:hypothetical protein